VSHGYEGWDVQRGVGKLLGTRAKTPFIQRTTRKVDALLESRIKSNSVVDLRKMNPVFMNGAYEPSAYASVLGEKTHPYGARIPPDSIRRVFSGDWETWIKTDPRQSRA
jgi:hypothetical protein